jgi:hypothetical protein
LLGTLGGDLGLFLGIFDYFLYFIIDDICWWFILKSKEPLFSHLPRCLSYSTS